MLVPRSGFSFPSRIDQGVNQSTTGDGLLGSGPTLAPVSWTLRRDSFLVEAFIIPSGRIRTARARWTGAKWEEERFRIEPYHIIEPYFQNSRVTTTTHNIQLNSL